MSEIDVQRMRDVVVEWEGAHLVVGAVEEHASRQDQLLVAALEFRAAVQRFAPTCIEKVAGAPASGAVVTIPMQARWLMVARALSAAVRGDDHRDQAFEDEIIALALEIGGLDGDL